MKNKLIKSVLGVGLVLTMMVGTLTGCGNQETVKESESTQQNDSNSTEVPESSSEPEEEEKVELEPVTLKWLVADKEYEGSADIAEAFNKKLAEVLPNTTVEFEFTGNNWEYGEPWNMKIAAGEKIDLAWAGYCTNYLADVKNGNILGISELVSEYAPNLQDEMAGFASAYKSCTYEGELYGVPSIQPTSSGKNWAVWYDKEIAPYVDQEALLKELNSGTKLTQGMLDIVDKSFQGAIDAGVIEVGSDSWDAYYPDLTRPFGYQVLVDNQNIYYDPETEQVMHTFEIPETKMMSIHNAEWVEKGWITEKDILGQQPESAIQYFCYYSGNPGYSWRTADENGIYETKASTGRDRIYMLTDAELDSYIGMGGNSFGELSTYMVLPYTCENPERAIMLLNLLHDEPGTIGNDLYNLLCYGFEKNSEEAKEYGWFNYEAVEKDGQLVTDTSVRGENPSKGGITNWVIGNTYKVMSDGTDILSLENKEYCEYFNKEISPNRKRTPLSGATIDHSIFEEELNAMALVVNEYMGLITSGCGGVDKVDAVFEEAMKKLNEAGWETVKAGLEAQIAAHNAK